MSSSLTAQLGTRAPGGLLCASVRSLPECRELPWGLPSEGDRSLSQARESLPGVARQVAALAVFGALGALGCSEPPLGHVAFQVTSRPSTEASPAGSVSRAAGRDSAIVTLGGDTIVIRRADLVLRQIWLQPAETGECDPEEEEHCAELRNDPVVVGFPLADTAEHRFTSPARAGAYSGLQLDIYPPVRNRDSALVASHPEFAGISVRIEGRFMKASSWHDFVATSDLTGIQELALERPLEVRAGDTTRVTLRLDLARIFLDPNGTRLEDPARGVGGRAHAHVVKDNIRTALHAFRDDGQNGLEDDSGPSVTVSESGVQPQGGSRMGPTSGKSSRDSPARIGRDPASEPSSTGRSAAVAGPPRSTGGRRGAAH
jgi:hypothetical protein